MFDTKELEISRHQKYIIIVLLCHFNYITFFFCNLIDKVALGHVDIVLSTVEADHHHLVHPETGASRTL